MERSTDVDDLLPDLGLADVLQQRPVGLGSVRHVVRIAVAVTVSFVIALAVSRSTFALFAPVTTLMVVQSSPWSTLGVSVQRILGTGIGVLVASVWVNLVGLSWWSFLLGVLASLLIARRLSWSLGGQLQIPVAVVFVLALGAGSLGEDLWRVFDVVIGGLVGIAAVFVFPARPRPERFEAALRAYRDAVISTMRQVGSESGSLDRSLADDEMHAFVTPSRRLRDLAETSRSELVRLVESSHLNMRAGGVSHEIEGLALRMRRLSGIGVQVRGIVGAANRLYDREGVVPILDGARFGALMEEVVALMEVVLGGPGMAVTIADRARADELDRDLQERLRATADELARERGGVGGMLSSVSLLGRLDHIRQQLADFPGGPVDSPGEPQGRPGEET